METYCPLRFVIEGKPIAWKRAGKHGKRHYDPQLKQKLFFGWQVRSQLSLPIALFSGPTRLECKFYFAFPTSWPKSKRQSIQRHVSDPDVDNLQKFISDAIVGILIRDDNILCSLSSEKFWDHTARTEFILYNLDPL